MSNEPEARKPLLVRASDHAKLPERSFSHPLNPSSLLRGQSLGDLVGLSRIGVHHLRIPPGKESFVYHTHRCEEEWIYILSGRGVAEIGDESFEVGPGDFMGFPAPSVGHHLKNPFDEELVYLSGGERKEAEIADFPRNNKRLVRFHDEIMVYPIDAAQPFGPAETEHEKGSAGLLDTGNLRADKDGKASKT